jgi:hypothetical protein
MRMLNLMNDQEIYDLCQEDIMNYVRCSRFSICLQLIRLRF